MFVLALFTWGCGSELQVELIPVFPSDQPDLLSELGVEYLDIEPTSVDGSHAKEIQRIYPGERLSMKLQEGKWTVEVRGITAGLEVVYGKTIPFEVKSGVSDKVRFFLGKSRDFNQVALEPLDLADAMGDLIGHTAVGYTDEEDHPWILVAGGKRSVSGAALAEAYLVDPVEFQVERLPNLKCTRFGHDAFTVTTETGKAIVLAGGVDGSCLGSLEVFNTATRTFETKDACESGNTRGAVPELTQEDGVQNGWVFVPGFPCCRVDIFSDSTSNRGENDWNADLEVPKKAMMAASNDQGQILVVAPDVTFLDRSLPDSSLPHCFDPSEGSWRSSAVWSGFEERIGGKLLSFSDGNFLYFGGEGPGGTTPAFPWALISTQACTFTKIVEGPWETNQPNVGMAFIDLELPGGVGLLATGGRKSDGLSSDEVHLFIRENSVGVPTWHDLSGVQGRSWTISLEKGRSGHAIASLDDGNKWIIGGGPAVSEIFVRGKGSIATDWKRMDEERTPTLTAVGVLDTALGDPPADDSEPSLAKLFKDAFIAQEGGGFFSLSGDFTNLFFMATGADRGVDPMVTGNNLVGADTCESNHVDPTYGTFLGPSSEVDTDRLSGSLTLAEDIGDARTKAGDTVINASKTGGDCGWRQLLRSGMNGLKDGASAVVENNNNPRLGVNVMFLVTSQDDCSEKVYTASQAPVTMGLSGTCDETEFDDYFQLPPDPAEIDNLKEAVLQVSWDPADLIVVVMGNTDGSTHCPVTGLQDLYPTRRLIATLEDLESIDVTHVKVDLCQGATLEQVQVASAEVMSRIRDRNPLQACLPEGMIDIDYEDVLDRDEQRFKAYIPQETIVEGVHMRCGLYFSKDVTSLLPDDESPEHKRVIGIDDGAMVVGVDTDGRGDCTSEEKQVPWLIRVDEDTVTAAVDQEDISALTLICLP